MTQTERALLPVYLFNGEDILKQETLLRRLTKRIEESGDISFNSVTFQAAAVKTPDELLDACYTLPFNSPVRMVTVKDVDKLAKPVLDELVDYVQDPCDSTILVLIAQKLAANTRLFKALKQSDPKAIVDCSPKKRSELPTLVRSMAISHGVTISTDAAAQLIDRLGTSTVSLNNELQKLATYVQAAGRDTVSRQDIAAVVARVAEVKPWDLADALTSREAIQSLTLVSRMPDQTPMSLLGICVTRLRDILSIKALKRRGVTDIAGYLGQPEWRLRNQIKASSSFSRPELVGFLAAAAELEKQMKSGGDADMLFEKWLISVCDGSFGS